MGTEYISVIVLDSQISLNGQHIIVGLKCYLGKLNVGTVLSSIDGKQWKVVDNELLNCFPKETQKMLRVKESESIFMFDLQGIGHMETPSVGQELRLIGNAS